jgi:hypothetical protein
MQIGNPYTNVRNTELTKELENLVTMVIKFLSKLDLFNQQLSTSILRVFSELQKAQQALHSDKTEHIYLSDSLKNYQTIYQQLIGLNNFQIEYSLTKNADTINKMLSLLNCIKSQYDKYIQDPEIKNSDKNFLTRIDKISTALKDLNSATVIKNYNLHESDNENTDEKQKETTISEAPTLT